VLPPARHHPDRVDRCRRAPVGRRWGIEEAFAITKSETGLDEHQVRRWTPWYRHAILSMLAAAFLAVTRAHVPANPTAWPAA
jgi:SRSO17 transposase